jgi:hypothetical protein
VEYLKAYVANPPEFKEREEPPPPPIIDPESKELEYFVEKIVNHRYTKKGNKISYLTHWKGYPDYEDTWQSVDSLKGHEAKIADYWKSTGQRDPTRPTKAARQDRQTKTNKGTRHQATRATRAQETRHKPTIAKTNQETRHQSTRTTRSGKHRTFVADFHPARLAEAMQIYTIL